MQRSTLWTMAVPVALIALAATASKTFGDDHDKKTVIQLSEAVQAPGGVVLQPGKYVLILLNSSSNRNIVEIRSEDAKQLYATTFTTRANRVTRTGNVAITFYEMPAGSPPALREWFWPGDYDGQEFLYPHKEAQEITAASHQTVPELTEDQAAANQPNTVSPTPAAAPASDSSAVASTSVASTAAASTSDASTETQSAQSDTSVSTQQSAVATQQATAVEQSQVDTPVSTQPVQQDQLLAQATPPAAILAPATAEPVSSQSSNDNSALPQTASDLPLIAMFGFVSIALAIGTGIAARGRV
jgi:hypothetical protein